MLKKIILIICLIICAGFLGSFLVNKTQEEKKVTIQFASWGSESEINILKPILKDFEIENPDIKVDFMHIPQNYFQKIHLLFASNTAPDVIFINNQYLPIYANAGVLEDLSAYDKDFEYEKFYPKSLETLSWKGKIYAVPRDISNMVIFYNKDLFDKNKTPYPHSGWNFDDYLATAKKLTHLPETFGVSFEEEPLFYLPYLTSEGLNDVPEYDKVKNNKGLQLYADLRRKYHVAPTKDEIGSTTSAQLFLQGRIGMLLSGRWLVPKFRQEATFDWDVAEFPKMSAGSIVPMDSSGWAISKSSKHKPQAAKLIKYLSGEKNSKEFAKSGLIVPARIDSANSKYFLDGQKPKNAQTFLSVIETSQPTKVNVNYRQVIDELKSKNEALFNK
jgi:multiple sugar transport system substrate-binding protein